jgi:hAT family C-terminal dimerisation region
LTWSIAKGRKYAEFIAEQVKQCIDSHSDTALHVSSVTDTASNVVSASFMLTDDDCKNCFNHELKLCVDEVLGGPSGKKGKAEEAAQLIATVNDVCAWIRTSKPERQLFEQIQVVNGGAALQLKEENVTRWEGKFLTLERFVLLKNSLKSLCKHDSSTLTASLEKYTTYTAQDTLLSKEFWRKLKEMLDVLKVLHVVSKQAQAEGTVTISCIPYWIQELKKACIRTENESRCSAAMKEAFLAVFEERLGYYTEEDSTVLRSAALDPRFSNLELLDIEGALVDQVWDSIIDETILLYKKDPLAEEYDRWKEEKTSFLRSMAKPVRRTLLKLSTSFLKDNGTIPGGDPLMFWKSVCDGSIGGDLDKDQCLCFSPFSTCARMFFCIPAGSSPSEREFSASGRVYTELRNKMSDETLEMLVVIRDFIRSPEFDFQELCLHLARDIAKK